MTRMDIPPSLELLVAANTIEKKVQALKLLKNDIIGHERRKAATIHQGIIQVLCQAIKASETSKDTRQSVRGAKVAGSARTINELTLEGQMRLQSIFITTSLAHAGNPFIAPLVAGNVVSHLQDALNLDYAHPKITLESLRALVTITSSLWDDPTDSYRELHNNVSNLIIHPGSLALESILRLLGADSESQPPDDQLILVLMLLRYVSIDCEQRQKIIVSAGILDFLAFKLASWIAGNQSLFHLNAPYLLSKFNHCPRRGVYSHLVRAIAAIIGKSKYRSARFMSCRDFLTVFPETPEICSSSDVRDRPSDELHDSESRVLWERFLPQVSSHTSRSDSYGTASFPPLASKPQQPTNLSSDAIAWLIHMARSTTGEERVSTMILLSTILNATRLNTQYERHLALLVIPLLVKMISDYKSSTPTVTSVRSCSDAVLALGLIVSDSETLQQAAVDADVIQHLCAHTKSAYEYPKQTPKAMWSPDRRSIIAEVRTFDDPRKLGPNGLTLQNAEMAILKARCMSTMSYLIAQSDKSRKIVIDHGYLTYVADCLSPHPISNDDSSLDTEPEKELMPCIAILAAMELVTALSRSISVLRTSLIDAKIAIPIFDLARNKNMEIKISAVNVLTNLVMHFSPMRDSLVRVGVQHLLIEYARSSNIELKKGALWAFKHLVLAIDSGKAIKWLEELGPGYLMSLLNGESSSQKSHLAIANVRGEKVDLLNEEPDMDVDGPLVPSEDEQDQESNSIFKSIEAEYGPPINYLPKLRPMKYAEHHQSARSRRDDIELQHHALDIVRNMTSEPTEHLPVIIDQILNLLGSPRFFEIVISKFKPRYSSTATSNTPTTSTAGKRPTLTTPGSSERHIPHVHDAPTYIDSTPYTHPDVIMSACYVIAHFANGRSTQRTLVLSQPHLLNLLSPHFLHPKVEIRKACLWFVHNSLWGDNNDDGKAVRQRASELRKAGLEERCRLLLGDPVMDIHETAKLVTDMFVKILGSPAAAVMRVWE
ncbi:ARM repeat-containing protein [Microthyrium microscopicum]|uniref:ARM repeat-containing protein n=1 Tax=Microthyrium microscopicum TaxID=703497 RepID=A0A6A6TTP7_9PEZI|nr:ARM repeat-containing protein [Microthyrium microscopicum]